MRLDKYLKVAGLIPRRTVANEACDAGKVRVNGVVAKAAHELGVGDRISFDLGRGAVSIEVLEVPAGNVSKARQVTLYRATGKSEDGSGAT